MTEQYSGGYSPLIIDQFKQRSFAKQGAFLYPYIKPGLSVLDCGCGPGSMTLDIAELVYPEIVYGVDFSEIQIEQALQLQQQRNIDNVHFNTASAYQLPFANAQFDLVFAHALLYHLAQPELAIAEFHRVLKPGGRIALRDACHLGDMLFPNSNDLSIAWELIRKIFAYQGGNIDFGAEHKKYLLAQNFQEIQLSFTYDNFSNTPEKNSICDYWCHFLTVEHRQLILEQQWASEKELNVCYNAFHIWHINPASFFARARCEAIAIK